MSPLQVAMIGCGAVANLIYRPALNETRAEIELIGATDLTRQNAEGLLQEFPGAKFFADYHRMFAELKPEAVIVALPHNLHKTVSIQAMRMGIDVFCEKPMAMNSAECDEIEAAVRETGQVFTVNMFRRSYPSTRAIRQIVEMRALGAPVAFEITEGGPYGWPAMSDSFVDPKVAGGGVLIDSGVHTLDLLQWWLGGIDNIEFCDDATAEGVECDCTATLDAGLAHGSLRMSRSVALPNVYRLDFEHGWIEWDHDDATRFRCSMGDGHVIEAEVKCEAAWGGGNRFTYALIHQLKNFAHACRHDSVASVVDASEARKSVDAIACCYAKRTHWPYGGEWVDPQVGVGRA